MKSALTEPVHFITQSVRGGGGCGVLHVSPAGSLVGPNSVTNERGYGVAKKCGLLNLSCFFSKTALSKKSFFTQMSYGQKVHNI